MNQKDIMLGVDIKQSSLNGAISTIESAITKIENKKINLSVAGVAQAEKEIRALTVSLNSLKALQSTIGGGFDEKNLGKFSQQATAAAQSLTRMSSEAKEAVRAVDNFNKGVGSFSKGMSASERDLGQFNRQVGVAQKGLETLGKTMLWSSANRVFDEIVNSVGDAIKFINKLDESLNQIKLVSGLSSQEVAGLAVEANKAAKALGQTTIQYSDAAMLYLQQGKSLAESQRLAEATLIATNITGEKSTRVVELMTSALNGYNYEASKAMEVLDKFAAVGAATASDFNELATGFSKVAAMASTAGVEFDQLNSMIATVASATREAPETIGTSFKTIFSRIQSIKQGEETDENGDRIDYAELNRYAQAVQDATGIQFFDGTTGQLRDAGILMEEIGNAWDGMSKNVKFIVAEAMAGQRQASRLHSLFNSWDEYQSTLTVSMEAQGTALEQNAVRMDSLIAANNRVRSSFEELFMTMTDSDAMKGILNVISSIVEGMTRVADAAGGLKGILTMVAPLVASFAVSKGLPLIGSTIETIKGNKDNRDVRGGGLGLAGRIAAQKNLRADAKVIQEKEAEKGNILSNKDAMKEALLAKVKGTGKGDFERLAHELGLTADTIESIRDTLDEIDKRTSAREEARAKQDANINKRDALLEQTNKQADKLAEVKGRQKDFMAANPNSLEAQLREQLTARKVVGNTAINSKIDKDGNEQFILKDGEGEGRQLSKDELVEQNYGNLNFNASDSMGYIGPEFDELQRKYGALKESYSSEVDKALLEANGGVMEVVQDILDKYGVIDEAVRAELISKLQARHTELLMEAEAFEEEGVSEEEAPARPKGKSKPKKEKPSSETEEVSEPTPEESTPTRPKSESGEEKSKPRGKAERKPTFSEDGWKPDGPETPASQELQELLKNHDLIGEVDKKTGERSAPKEGFRASIAGKDAPTTHQDSTVRIAEVIGQHLREQVIAQDADFQAFAKETTGTLAEQMKAFMATLSDERRESLISQGDAAAKNYLNNPDVREQAVEQFTENNYVRKNVADKKGDSIKSAYSKDYLENTFGNKMVYKGGGARVLLSDTELFPNKLAADDKVKGHKVVQEWMGQNQPSPESQEVAQPEVISEPEETLETLKREVEKKPAPKKRKKAATKEKPEVSHEPQEVAESPSVADIQKAATEEGPSLTDIQAQRSAAEKKLSEIEAQIEKIEAQIKKEAETIASLDGKAESKKPKVHTRRRVVAVEEDGLSKPVEWEEEQDSIRDGVSEKETEKRSLKSFQMPQDLDAPDATEDVADIAVTIKEERPSKKPSKKSKGSAADYKNLVVDEINLMKEELLFSGEEGVALKDQLFNKKTGQMRKPKTTGEAEEALARMRGFYKSQHPDAPWEERTPSSFKEFQGGPGVSSPEAPKKGGVIDRIDRKYDELTERNNKTTHTLRDDLTVRQQAQLLWREIDPENVLARERTPEEVAEKNAKLEKEREGEIQKEDGAPESETEGADVVSDSAEAVSQHQPSFDPDALIQKYAGRGNNAPSLDDSQARAKVVATKTSNSIMMLDELENYYRDANNNKIREVADSWLKTTKNPSKAIEMLGGKPEEFLDESGNLNQTKTGPKPLKISRLLEQHIRKLTPELSNELTMAQAVGQDVKRARSEFEEDAPEDFKEFTKKKALVSQKSEKLEKHDKELFKLEEAVENGDSSKKTASKIAKLTALREQLANELFELEDAIEADEDFYAPEGSTERKRQLKKERLKNRKNLSTIQGDLENINSIDPSHVFSPKTDTQAEEKIEEETPKEDGPKFSNDELLKKWRKEVEEKETPSDAAKRRQMELRQEAYLLEEEAKKQREVIQSSESKIGEIESQSSQDDIDPVSPAIVELEQAADEKVQEIAQSIEQVEESVEATNISPRQQTIEKIRELSTQNPDIKVEGDGAAIYKKDGDLRAGGMAGVSNEKLELALVELEEKIAAAAITIESGGEEVSESLENIANETNEVAATFSREDAINEIRELSAQNPDIKVEGDGAGVYTKKGDLRKGDMRGVSDETIQLAIDNLKTQIALSATEIVEGGQDIAESMDVAADTINQEASEILALPAPVQAGLPMVIEQPTQTPLLSEAALERMRNGEDRTFSPVVPRIFERPTQSPVPLGPELPSFRERPTQSPVPLGPELPSFRERPTQSPVPLGPAHRDSQEGVAPINTSGLAQAQEEVRATTEVVAAEAEVQGRLSKLVGSIGKKLNFGNFAIDAGIVAESLTNVGVAAAGVATTLGKVGEATGDIDKVEAGLTGLLTTVGMVAPSFGPVGMAIGAAAGLAAGMVKPIMDWFNPLEQARKKNQEILDIYYKQSEALSSKLQQLQEASKTEKSLLEEIDAAGGMNMATEEQKAAYADLQNQIGELDRTTVAYYDNAGNAVLKHKVDLDAQIEKVKEAKRENESVLINNRKSFIEEAFRGEKEALQTIDKLTAKLEGLQKRQDATSAGSKRYFELGDEIAKINTSISEMQSNIQDSALIIQDNVILPAQRASKEFEKLGDSAKGIASEAFSSDDMESRINSLREAATIAESLGVNLKEAGLDEEGIIKTATAYADELEVKMQNVTLALTEIDNNPAFKNIAEAIDGADRATQTFIGSIASTAKTAEGARIAIEAMVNAMGDGKVINISYAHMGEVQKKINQADIDKRNKEIAAIDSQLAEKQRQLSEMELPYRPQEASGMTTYTDAPSYDVAQQIVATEREIQELAETRTRSEAEIARLTKEQSESLGRSLAYSTQFESSRSTYYMGLASDTSEGGGYDNLAKSYEESYGAAQSFMGASYTTEQGYYGSEDETLKYQSSSEPVADLGGETPETQGEVISYDVQVESNLTDFIDDMDNLYDSLGDFGSIYEKTFEDLTDSTKTFGESITETLGDAIGTSVEGIEDGVKEMQKALKDVNTREAIAGGSEDLIKDLEEVAEKGVGASADAMANSVSAMDDYRQRVGEMYAAMNADDAVYWQNVVAQNQDEINLSDATMGIKAANYATYAEYKAAQDQWMRDNAVLLQSEETSNMIEGLNQQVIAEANWVIEAARLKGLNLNEAEVMSKAEQTAHELAQLGKMRAEAEAAMKSAQFQEQAFTAAANAAKGHDAIDKAVSSVIDQMKTQNLANIAVGTEYMKIIDSAIADVKKGYTGDLASLSGIAPGEILMGGAGTTVDSGLNLNTGGGTAPPKPSFSKPNSGMPGGGSGGGGDKDGGGGKESAPKEQEDMEWEKDWYHDINILLKKNADAAKKLSDVEDRLYGDKKLTNMRQQAELAKERMELNKQALEIAKQEAQHYKDKIAKEGVSFNGDGSVKNYNDFIQGKVNAANSIADADAKKAAQDDVKELIENIKKYEDVLFGTIQSYEDEIEAARQEVQDKLLEALKYEFEIIIKVKDVIIDDNEFINDFLEGIAPIGDILDRLTESGGASLDKLSDLGDKFKEIINSDLDGGLKIEELEAVKEELMEAFEQLKELNEAISEAIIDSIDSQIEALEYAFAELEAITSTAESMIELNELFGHGEDYEAINQMLDVIAQANELQLESMLSAKDELTSLRDSLEEGTEEWKAANDAVLEMDQSIRDMTVKTIELYRQQLTNAFNGIMKELEKAMSGGTTLDKMRDELSKVREEQDRYADSIDQTLFKQKMLAKIQADIANTTDPKKQQQLQEFYEKQVETLGEKGQLLESELQRTEMLYDITMAQMALEDARANKSIMKLTRDDQGNWSHQYMADASAIQAAQDALSQKLADLMEFDKQQFEATQDYIIQKRQEYIGNMQELHEMYLNGEFESEAEYQAAMDALTQEFNDQMIQLEADYGDLKLNLNESTLSALMGSYIDFSGTSEEIWNQFYTALGNKTQEELDLLEQHFGTSLSDIKSLTGADLESLKSAFESMYTDVNSKTSAGLGVLEGTWETMREAIADKITGSNGINKYLQDYAAKVDAIAKLTGYDDLKTSSDGLKDASKNLSTQLDVEKQKHEALHAAMKKEFDQIRDAVKAGGPLDELRKAYEKIRKEIETYISKINEAISKQQQLANGSKPPTTTTPPPTPAPTPTPPKPTGPQGNGKLDKGDKVRVKNQGANAFLDSAGTKVRPWADQAKAAGIAWNAELYVVNVGNGKGALSKTNNINGAIAWLNPGDLSGFETGGYTGSFGNQGGPDGRNGKLALLHEKELVLNKQDTANMLDMISMTRDFYKSPSLSLDGFSGGVQQTVNINADFSGVRNSAEIENAFENLVNRAIQYVK